MSDQPEIEQTRWRDRVHDHHLKLVEGSAAPVITYGAESLKAVTLLNAGLLAALFAFVAPGAISNPALARPMIFVLPLFGIGLVSGVAAAGASYLAQYCYAASTRAMRLTDEPPFISRTPESEAKSALGRRWHKAAIGCASLAVLLAFTGIGVVTVILLRRI